MRKCSPYTISIISLVILMFLGCKSDSDNELIIQGVAHDSRQNIRIENIQISHFEVAGLQFNGFKNVKLINVEIGPSSTNVKRML